MRGQVFYGAFYNKNPRVKTQGLKPKITAI